MKNDFPLICSLSDALDITHSALESSGYVDSCAVSCMHGCACMNICTSLCDHLPGGESKGALSHTMAGCHVLY